MGKYDWSNVPNKVKWIATDVDGVSNGFMEKPIIFDRDMWAVDSDYEAVEIDLPPYYGDWRKSLEKRPCSDQ